MGIPVRTTLADGVCTVTRNECECVGQEDGASCSDGDNCTQNDRCLNEVCVGDELVCEGSRRWLR